MIKINKELLIVLVVVSLFILASYLSGIFEKDIKGLVSERNIFAMFSYIGITASAVIIAPVSTLPLLPVAVRVWGPNMAASISILGWLVGSWVAFLLARRFGQGLVRRLIKVEKIEKFKQILPARKLFWFVVFARFVLPVDIVSYAIGLLTSMRLESYLLATFIGVVPFAFIFAHGSTFSAEVQIVSIVGMLFLVLLNFRKIKRIGSEIFDRLRV